MKQNTAVICLSKVNGGMELASVKLARLLSNDLNTFFIAKKGSFIEKNRKTHFYDYNINLHVVDFKSNFSIKLIKKLRYFFTENKIKNIIFLGASEMKSLHFAVLGLDINFIIRQGSKKTTSKKDFIHTLLYSKVNYFIGNCEYMKKNIEDILPIPKNAQVKKIYSSLKISTNIDFKKETTPINIVHLGRINPGKGQFEAIKSCEILYENNISFNLTFLGDFQDKEYYQSIQKYVDTLHFKNEINFVGFTSNIKSYLENSDIFLFPSLGEGMSNAIIESLGYGLIPIIYNDTSSPEFKDLGFHIYLTKENNIKYLKNILLDVASNISEEKEKAKLNHGRSLKIFSREREKEEYISLLK